MLVLKLVESGHFFARNRGGYNIIRVETSWKALEAWYGTLLIRVHRAGAMQVTGPFFKCFSGFFLRFDGNCFGKFQRMDYVMMWG